MPKNFNLVLKKFYLVTKIFNLVLKTCNLVPKRFQTSAIEITISDEKNKDIAEKFKK